MANATELNEMIAEVLRTVTRANLLEQLMKALVRYFSSDASLGQCTIALLDPHKHVFIPRWSSHEAMRPDYVLRYDKKGMDFPNAPSISLRTDELLVVNRIEHEDIDIPQVKGIVDIETMMIAPVIHEGIELGVVICHHDVHRVYTQTEKNRFEQTVRAVSPFIYSMIEKEEIHRKAMIQEIMLDSVKELHSSIDVNVVLQELMEIIDSFFPKLQMEIWMTIDDFSPSLTVNSLNLLNITNPLLSEAYHEGQMKLSKTDLDQNGLHRIEIYAPLIGNQGIYGVLQLTGETRDRIDDYELKFIKSLAETAGIAFENARLYQQSTNLIKQLRVTHDITQKLNRSLKRNEIIDLVASELKQTFDSDICVIFEPNEHNQTLEVKVSNYEELKNQAFPIHAGFSGHCYNTKEFTIISDMENDARLGHITPFVRCSSLLVGPILIDDQVEAIITIGNYEKNSFTFDHYQLLETIAKHASFALRNAKLHEEVERMATTDQLTELFKRHVLDEKIHTSQTIDAFGSLILIDIDHFKQVNDTYGHQVGDEALKKVSGIIRSNVRKQDLASRWGGEELAIYLPKTNLAIAQQVAERIRERVNELQHPCITVSCGVSYWHQEDEKVSVESLFHRADKALYRAKDSGRNCVIVS